MQLLMAIDKMLVDHSELREMMALKVENMGLVRPLKSKANMIGDSSE